jgi:hypothetical protein
MNLLTGFTESPFQTTTIGLDDGSSALLTLWYRPQQRGWFYDLTYKGITMQGQRLVYSQNLLRQFIHQLPFGLACLTTDLSDPRKSTDLSSRHAVLILLSAAEVQSIEKTHFTRND